MKRKDIKNIAIIAYVDHGRTMLVDQLLRQSDMLRVNQGIQEHVMDSNDLERERGIATLSKNMAVSCKDTKINIIDTSRHADFGGGVEHMLKIVNDVALIVDAHKGPVPQTKFVFQEALDLNLSVIICINRTNRPEARPKDVMDEALEPMVDLDAADKQLDCPFIYAPARGRLAKYKTEGLEADISPLSKTIISHVLTPGGNPDTGTQAFINTVDYDGLVDHIGIRRVDDGGLKVNQEYVLVDRHEPDGFKKAKIGKLYEFDGLRRMEVQEAGTGSIVVISGIADIHIGDTIRAPNSPESTPFRKISEPAITTYSMINGSPLAGQGDKYITSCYLRDRLFRELNTDINLRMEGADSADYFKMSGRGELHPSVLTENMRREDFEFVISEAEALYKYDKRNRRLGPMKLAYMDVSEEYTGVVIQELASRKGALQGMSQVTGGYSGLEFPIPSRGLIDYRGDLMTDAKGNGTLNTILDDYSEYRDDLFYRQTNSLIAFEAGEAIAYNLFNTQEGGTPFIGPGVKMCFDMIAGRSPKTEDIEISICRIKKLTNIHSSSADEALKLTPPRIMSPKQILDFVDMDELLEVTPENPRIYRRVLDPTLRKRAPSKNK